MDETMPTAPEKESVSKGRKTARRIVRGAPLFLVGVAVLAMVGLWFSGGLHPIHSIAAMDFFTYKKLEFPFSYLNGTISEIPRHLFTQAKRWRKSATGSIWYPA